METLSVNIMPIVELSHKDILEARRLGKCLDSDLIPLRDLRDFLRTIQQKTIPVSAEKLRAKKAQEREDLKNHYRMKIRAV